MIAGEGWCPAVATRGRIPTGALRRRTIASPANELRLGEPNHAHDCRRRLVSRRSNARIDTSRSVAKADLPFAHSATANRPPAPRSCQPKNVRFSRRSPGAGCAIDSNSRQRFPTAWVAARTSARTTSSGTSALRVEWYPPSGFRRRTLLQPFTGTSSPARVHAGQTQCRTRLVHWLNFG
jgi:hypothetical protein